MYCVIVICVSFLFELIMLFLMMDSIGDEKYMVAVLIIINLLFVISVETAIYCYLKRMICYIDINDKMFYFVTLSKVYRITQKDIASVHILSDKYIIKICDGTSLFAYRKIWLPYVKKDGVEHKGISIEDFMGIRVDEEQS